MSKRKNKRHPLYPEPGAELLDNYSGLPKLEPPKPLPKKKLSAADVQEYVEYYGLGFCVYHYIPSERIADLRLRSLWRKARSSLGEVVEYLDF